MEPTPHGEQPQQQAKEAMRQASAKTTEAVRSAAESGSSYLENQKRLAAAEVDGYACALHETARQLHDQSQDRVADYAERVATGLDHFARHLRERDFRDNMDRVADFARRRPALFLGGAVAAGFAFTRFLKSSPKEMREEFREMKESAGEKSEEMKEKLAAGMEKAKEAGRETVEKTREAAREGKEKATEGRREHKSEKKRAAEPAKEPRTAAEEEIPVILKPHEPEPPERPAPKS